MESSPVIQLDNGSIQSETNVIRIASFGASVFWECYTSPAVEWCEGYSYKPEELLEARRSELARLGGSPEAIARVIEYGRNHFTLRNLPSPPVLPMPDEAHVAYWKTLPQDGADLFTELQRRLPQFAIPLGDGISKTPAYVAVIQRGEPFDEKKFAGR